MQKAGMLDNWIVVADAARARVFKPAAPDYRLVELHDLSHPESTLHEGDLRTGGKGAASQRATKGEHQSDPRVTTDEKHAEAFAGELADFLRKKRTQNHYAGLVLVAAPDFLGHLREKLDAATAKLVEREIDKNWAQHDRRRIERLLN